MQNQQVVMYFDPVTMQRSNCARNDFSKETVAQSLLLSPAVQSRCKFGKNRCSFGAEVRISVLSRLFWCDIV